MSFTLDTFKIYDVEFNEMLGEQLERNLMVFNEATRGGIILTTESLKGQYEKKAMFKALSSTTIKDRDPLSVAAIVFDTLDQLENIGVKVNRYNAIQKTADSFAKLAVDPENTFSQIIGVLTADLITADMIETAVSAIMGATQAEASHVLGNGLAIMTFKDINAARFVYGDQFTDIACILMHSTSGKDLVDLNIDEKLTNVGGLTIQNGSFASLGVPVVISDIAALTMTAGKGVLFLTTGAVVLTNSENTRVYTDFDPTTENTMLRMKREWAMNVSCKGFSYTAATASPSNAVLVLPASWTKTATDHKSLGAVIFNTLN